MNRNYDNFYKKKWGGLVVYGIFAPICPGRQRATLEIEQRAATFICIKLY